MPLTDMVPFGKKSTNPAQCEQNPFAELRRELDSIVDNFLQGIGRAATEPAPAGFVPRLDLREDAQEIVVSAELPGMDEKDIDVSVTREALTIRGEKKEENGEKGTGFYRTERRYGSFCRSIPLPVEIDQDRASAAFKKGVLRVTLPKKSPAPGTSNAIKVRIS
ncbi:MAG: Hsp20/alpha crystallin family protein [Thermodesulfovibrionales bacterium]